VGLDLELLGRLDAQRGQKGRRFVKFVTVTGLQYKGRMMDNDSRGETITDRVVQWSMLKALFAGRADGMLRSMPLF
jgi:hypothetical protein